MAKSRKGQKSKQKGGSSATGPSTSSRLPPRRLLLGPRPKSNNIILNPNFQPSFTFSSLILILNSGRLQCRPEVSLAAGAVGGWLCLTFRVLLKFWKKVTSDLKASKGKPNHKEGEKKPGEAIVPINESHMTLTMEHIDNGSDCDATHSAPETANCQNLDHINPKPLW